MKYYDKRFSLITGDRFLFNEIIGFISGIDLYCSDENDKLLDVGCGTRPYIDLFKRYRYEGIDNQSLKNSTPDRYGDITAIPSGDNVYGGVMTVWVLPDIYDLERAIKEISRVLKNNGYYFAVENQAAYIHNQPADYFRMAPFALIKLCEANNLRIVKYKSFGGDFAHVGFSLILICRHLFENHPLLHKIARPVYTFMINLIFYPLDKFFRSSRFKGRFELNSEGWCYVFQKMTDL